MIRMEYTCVLCPNGCPLVAYVDDKEPPEITRIEGSVCPKGDDWVRQEILNPMRTISSSVRVQGGDSILASVRTDRAIPLAKIMDVMEEIKQVVVDAPLEIGAVVLSRPAGCDTDIIVTRSVRKSA
ncbi:MAG: DUF1667 domain-containing protein [Acidobacteriota bacterium]|jgi:CxxC motif-containing protein|nr:DUF1667 domain-containing protein [Acidobacteriota bacterium]NLT33586.1 DUF1667 domain-containing protein [Acidobacteriota bacterium]